MVCLSLQHQDHTSILANSLVVIVIRVYLDHHVWMLKQMYCLSDSGFGWSHEHILQLHIYLFPSESECCNIRGSQISVADDSRPLECDTGSLGKCCPQNVFVFGQSSGTVPDPRTFDLQLSLPHCLNWLSHFKTISKSADEPCLCSCTTHWHTLHHICSLPYIPIAAHATMKAMNSSRQMISVHDLFCKGPLNSESCCKGSPETKKNVLFDTIV